MAEIECVRLSSQFHSAASNLQTTESCLGEKKLFVNGIHWNNISMILFVPNFVAQLHYLQEQQTSAYAPFLTFVTCKALKQQAVSVESAVEPW